ncbi:MAG TPA: zf-HC2 domain-containing protein [Gemmatimonadales bacterium]|nr:zf-HC2 domain-containing protein [Gemmatimonadales bacterium]
MSQLDRTNCEEAFRRLNDYLDRRLTADELRIIEEHLKICAWCAREFNFEASVLYGVKRKLRQLEAPPELVSKILSQLPPTHQAES